MRYYIPSNAESIRLLKDFSHTCGGHDNAAAILGCYPGVFKYWVFKRKMPPTHRRWVWVAWCLTRNPTALRGDWPAVVSPRIALRDKHGRYAREPGRPPRNPSASQHKQTL